MAITPNSSIYYTDYWCWLVYDLAGGTVIQQTSFMDRIVQILPFVFLDQNQMIEN